MTHALLPGLFSHTAAPLSGPPSGGSRVYSAISGNDVEDQGRFSVHGTVAIASTPDVPVSRRVRLFCKASGRLVRETWSDAAGNYVFHNVRVGPWLIVSHDHMNTYNAVIADNISGEPM